MRLVAVSARDDAKASAHSGITRWVVFSPRLRDPEARGCSFRSVSCRMCRSVLGTADDPVDAFLIAWRHRREMRRLSKRRSGSPVSGSVA